MKDYRQSILFIASILLFFSCGKDNKGNIPVDDGSIRYQLFQLEKKGWKSKLHSQKADDIKFTATEVPIQFYLLKDKGNHDLFEIDSLYQENKTERVIEFTYEQEDEEDLLKRTIYNAFL